MKKETQQLLDELTSLIGLKYWSRISQPCTGKLRGTTDYGVAFDNGAKQYFSNGMRGFHARVEKTLGEIKTFQANRQSYITFLRNQVQIDNRNAEMEGLSPVIFYDLIFNTEPGDYFLLPYVVLTVNGKRVEHYDTNISSAFLCNELACWKSRTGKIFTAGGVKKPDYIFCGVRFCSTDNLYKVKNEIQPGI